MLGVGDDCALFSVTPGMQLATSTDLLIEGRHFFSDVAPFALGHKALAVNLSDLAAMGARPLACLLGISLPQVDHDWLQAFSQGFHQLSAQAACPLVGGDTTRSNDGIVISVTVMGEVAGDQALRRSAAQAGDDIWLTGTLGAPDIALRLLQKRLPADAALLAAVRPSLEQPSPPWAFAQRLVGVAHAALDISDGLTQDLGHILAASRCGAELEYHRLPVASCLDGLDDLLMRQAILNGGDVYQLCFTAPQKQRQHIKELAQQTKVQVTRVGRITTDSGLRILDPQGQAMALPAGGYDHFS